MRWSSRAGWTDLTRESLTVPPGPSSLRDYTLSGEEISLTASDISPLRLLTSPSKDKSRGCSPSPRMPLMVNLENALFYLEHLFYFGHSNTTLLRRCNQPINWKLKDSIMNFQLWIFIIQSNFISILCWLLLIKRNKIPIIANDILKCSLPQSPSSELTSHQEVLPDQCLSASSTLLTTPEHVWLTTLKSPAR